MSTKTKRTNDKTLRAAALVFGAACLSIVAATQPMARPDTANDTKIVRFLDSTPMDQSEPGAKAAAKGFVQAMSSGDAEALWMFASEEEQDAFQIKNVAFKAYAEEFPVLTRAKEVTVVRSWRDVDTDFLDLIVRDRNDRTYRTEIGLWYSDAGDWKLVSLDIKPTGDYVAGL